MYKIRIVLRNANVKPVRRIGTWQYLYSHSEHKFVNVHVHPRVPFLTTVYSVLYIVCTLYTKADYGEWCGGRSSFVYTTGSTLNVRQV